MKIVQCCALLTFVLATTLAYERGSGGTCLTRTYITDCRGCMNLDASRGPLGISEDDYLLRCCADMMTCYTSLVQHGINPHSLPHFKASQGPRSKEVVHMDTDDDDASDGDSSGEEEAETLRPSPRPSTHRHAHIHNIPLLSGKPRLIPVALEPPPSFRRPKLLDLQTGKPRLMPKLLESLPSLRLLTLKPRLPPLALKLGKRGGEDKEVNIKSQEDKQIKIKELTEDMEAKEIKAVKEDKDKEDRVKIGEDRNTILKLGSEEKKEEKQEKLLSLFLSKAVKRSDPDGRPSLALMSPDDEPVAMA